MNDHCFVKVWKGIVEDSRLANTILLHTKMANLYSIYAFNNMHCYLETCGCNHKQHFLLNVRQTSDYQQLLSIGNITDNLSYHTVTIRPIIEFFSSGRKVYIYNKDRVFEEVTMEQSHNNKNAISLYVSNK